MSARHSGIAGWLQMKCSLPSISQPAGGGRRGRTSGAPPCGSDARLPLRVSPYTGCVYLNTLHVCIYIL